MVMGESGEGRSAPHRALRCRRKRARKDSDNCERIALTASHPLELVPAAAKLAPTTIAG